MTLRPKMYYVILFVAELAIKSYPYEQFQRLSELFLNLLTPMSDQDKISPHNINQISDENKEKCQFGDN